MEDIGGVVMTKAMVGKDPKLSPNKLPRRFSGWSSLESRVGYSTTLFDSGAKVAQVPEALMATDLAGAAETEDGVETTIPMTHHHRTTTRDDQARAHTAQTSHKAGDLECGQVR